MHVHNNPVYNAHKTWVRIIHRSSLYIAKYSALCQCSFPAHIGLSLLLKRHSPVLLTHSLSSRTTEALDHLQLLTSHSKHDRFTHFSVSLPSSSEKVGLI